MSLSAFRCILRQSGLSMLTTNQALCMIKATPLWQMENNGKLILRTFKFHDYSSTLDFVTHTAELAEAKDHHPEITFGWGYATVQFYTHKVNGLTDNDFVMAAKLDDYYQESFD